ncbi:hypothetical protein EON81_08610 [bacterium]|nr:MAG: hypothetical protein EON81_08610 [bacterium]
MRRLFPVLAGLALSAAAFAAPSPVGKWTGKFDMKVPPAPANLNAQQKAMYTKFSTMMVKMRLPLTVNADKTWVMVATNPQDGKKSTQKGTWTQAGNKVTFNAPAVNGKKRPPMVTTLSADGKSMVIADPAGKGKLVFSKG